MANDRKEYNKRYYEKNKTRPCWKYNGEKVHCDVCDIDVVKVKYKRHCGGKMHQRIQEVMGARDI